MKDLQSYVFVFVAYLTRGTRGISPDVTKVSHAWVYGRFIEIQSSLRRKKLETLPCTGVYSITTDLCLLEVKTQS